MERLVRNEMNTLKRFAASFSEFLFVKDDLANRLKTIQNGERRLDEIIEKTNSLFTDILKTVPENQRKQLINTLSDYRFELIPKLHPGSTNVIMTKDQAKELVDLAQEKCKTCIEYSDNAQNCSVYKMLEKTALPDHYDTIICPYSLAEWAD